MKNNNKKLASIGAIIWLTYIAIMWIGNGIKTSISALFNYIKGSYLKRRIIIAIVYMTSAIFLAWGVWITDISLTTNLIGLLGTLGLALDGIVPDSRDKYGRFNKLKNFLHGAGALTAIIASQVYIVLGSILTESYWLITISVIAIISSVYMLKKNIKNKTTWIELIMLFAWLTFIMLNNYAVK